ncbi:MAG: M15 family metallopeptidase [Lachnospiraceae bacterium]|nr:M15 family metallopeptidase [Lachnospiraceae bacterium]
MEAGLTDSLFYSEEIGEKLQQRISGISYQENEHISLSELRYLRVLHMGFDGQTHIGELIVNASIAEDILEIMSELYKNSYPIEKMVLIDEYDAEDEPSMSDNNTSAFNYREIAGTSRISRHSFGVAIDINPRFNPYVKKMDSGETKISPANGAEYADRSQEFEHKIDERDLCYQLFTEHGFTWGGSWNSVKDYQHFEK